MENSIVTPPTNRGVENTQNVVKTHINKGKTNDLMQFVLFDWVQFTILSDSFSYFDENGVFTGYKDIKDYAIDLFLVFFNISYNDLFFEYKGINGYNSCCSYKNIYCYWHTTRADMGIHFKLSGQGCRDFEDLGLDYIKLFKSIYKYSFNINRVDISIDDFTDDYFTLSKLLYYCRKGRVVSRFKSVLNLEKICLSSSVENLGHTLQFGSKASNIQVTFYDKIKERNSQGFIVDSNISFWTRTELRFRHEAADLVIASIFKDPFNLNLTVKSILKNYIDFKSLLSSDSNLSRIDTALFWNDFLENVDSLRLSNYIPESTIVRKAKWLENNVSKTNFMVYISKLNNLCVDDISSDYLLKLLNNGVDKFNYKDLVIVNEYRINNKLEPFTQDEIFDYINDIKEVAQLIEQKEKNKTSDNI